ncbi:hypothetical protein VOLCADRAFT_100776, partial [Volvox carteri f. nagariensis]
TCFDLEVEVSSAPFSFFTIDSDKCQAVQAQIASDFVSQIAFMGLPPMVVNFTVDPTRCQPTKVSVCGSFVSEEEARKLEPWAALQSPLWLDSLVGQCNAVNSGLSFLLRSETDDCLKVITEKTDCKDTVNVTFPPCKCDNRKYATPFYVVPTPATQEPGRDPWTNLYCFKTKVAPKESVIAGPCNSSSTLHKAEIWADMSLRRQVRGFRLTPSGGTPRWASTSWGPSGANQLKAIRRDLESQASIVQNPCRTVMVSAAWSVHQKAENRRALGPCVVNCWRAVQSEVANPTMAPPLLLVASALALAW